MYVFLFEATVIVTKIHNVVVEINCIISESIFTFNLCNLCFSNVKLGWTINIKVNEPIIMNKK